MSRPRTGTRDGLRPTTARRPTTAHTRPGTRDTSPATPATDAGTDAETMSSFHCRGNQDDEERMKTEDCDVKDDYYQEELEDEDDADDVFAFAPPGLQNEPVTVVNAPTAALDTSTAHRGATPSLPSAPSRTRDDVYYYDEKYGAIYDSEGRMVKPPSYEHSQHQHQRQHASNSRESVHPRMPSSSANTVHSILHPTANSLTRNTSITWDNSTLRHGARAGRASSNVTSDSFNMHHRKKSSLTQANTFDTMSAQPSVFPRTTSALNVGWIPPHGATSDSSDLLRNAQCSSRIRVVELECEQEEDSPFPEVRASVSNLDDPELPTITFRSLTLGLGLSALVSVVNTFLSQRNPPIQIVAIVVQILVHPMGKFLANIMPIRSFALPGKLSQMRFSFNPGLWNIKEHTIVMIAATTGLNPAYSLSILLAQDLGRFWNDQRPFLYGFLFVCAPQLIGLALAGFTRRLLVEPASMIWPQNLVVSTVLNTLHAEEEISAKGVMTRFKFFILVATAAFLWYIFPGYLFQALSTFNWVCWIWPTNIPVNIVFGVATGLGASIITFDWTQIIFLGSPLITPWWAQVNLFSGFVVGIWLAAPIIYFTNTWNTAYLPMLTGASFDRHGSYYNVTIVSPDHKTFNLDAYESYSPVYISAGLIIAYFGGFALITAAIVHTALYHGRFIFEVLRRRRVPDDIHARLMKKYSAVPINWYTAIFVIGLAMSILLAAGYNTGLPIWALLISILIPMIYMLPFGFIFAISGLPAGVNLLSELVASYLLPGRPLPVMMFKTFSQQTMTFGLLMSQDLKLGHYMKVPPRDIFGIQIASIILNSFMQLLAKNYLVTHIKGLCEPDQADKFTCPTVNIFYTASIIWGAIGAERTFGTGSMYNSLYYGLMVGALLPFATWYLGQKLKWKHVRFFSAPILFVGMSLAPPASGINFTSAIVVGYLFQYLLRKKCIGWWSRYNFVTAGALDFGTIFSSLAIYFLLQLPKAGTLQLRWWANEVFTRTADYHGVPLLEVPEGGFGSLPKSR